MVTVEPPGKVSNDDKNTLFTSLKLAIKCATNPIIKLHRDKLALAEPYVMFLACVIPGYLRTTF